MPTKAKLYTNAKGYPVTHHSYSAGDAWQFCKRKYFWNRVQGWQEREQRASMQFGKIMEAAAQAFMLGKESAVVAFERGWAELDPSVASRCEHVAADVRPCELCAKQAVRNARYTYSEKEKDWARMREMGVGLARLFEARLPDLPLQNPRFQREIKKEILPGSEYGGLEFLAYLDIVSSPPLDHQLLPPLPEGSTEKHRALVTDVKTTSMVFENESGIVGLDQQLMAYSWATAIPDVAFLFLVKVVPEIKAGSRVSLLCTVTGHAAGSEAIVLEVTETGAILLADDATYEQLGEALKGLRGKARDAKREEFLTGKQLTTEVVPLDALTTQRIQFISARIPRERAVRAGYKIAREMVEIASETRRMEAGELTVFPEEGGVRFPNAKCPSCPFRGLCLNDGVLRDSLLTRAGEEWLDD